MSKNEEICNKFNLTLKEKRGIAKWVCIDHRDSNNNIFWHIKQAGFDPQKIDLNKDKSKFIKQDALDSENNIVEIKRLQLKANMCLIADTLAISGGKPEVMMREWELSLHDVTEIWNRFINDFYRLHKDGILDFWAREILNSFDYFIGRDDANYHDFVKIYPYELKYKVMVSYWGEFARINLVSYPKIENCIEIERK